MFDAQKQSIASKVSDQTMFHTVTSFWSRYIERRKARKAIFELNRLSNYELKDLGIDRSEIPSCITNSVDRRR